MKTAKRVSNVTDLKESDVVYRVCRGEAEPEAFVVVSTSPGSLASPIGKSMVTGMDIVIEPREPGEHFYIIEDREQAAG